MRYFFSLSLPPSQPCYYANVSVSERESERAFQPILYLSAKSQKIFQTSLSLSLSLSHTIPLAQSLNDAISKSHPFLTSPSLSLPSRFSSNFIFPPSSFGAGTTLGFFKDSSSSPSLS